MTLSHEETLRQAVEAAELLDARSEDYKVWIKVGRGLALLRDEAMKRAHNSMHRFRIIMSELLQERGLADKECLKDPAVRSRLLAIIDNYDKVHAWREGLKPAEKLRWNHPTTIWRRCPVFHKSSDKTKVTALPKNVAVQEPPRPEPVIDVSSLPMTAQQKVEAAIRQEKRKLAAEFEQYVQSEVRRRIDETVLPHYRRSIEETLKRIESLRSGKGVMPRAIFRLALSCSHSDNFPDDPEKQKRFRPVFEMLKNLEPVLCSAKEVPMPEAPSMPATWADWEKTRATVRAKRKAARQSRGREDQADIIHRT